METKNDYGWVWEGMYAFPAGLGSAQGPKPLTLLFF